MKTENVRNNPAVRKACQQAGSALDQLAAGLDVDAPLSELLDSGAGATVDDQALVNDLLKVLGGTEKDKALVARLSRDARCSFRLADNGWSLLLDIEPAVGNGVVPTYSAIFRALEQKGISKGIDTLAIEKAVRQSREGEVVKGACLVRGQQPVAGVDGYIEYYLRPGCRLEPEGYHGTESLPESLAKRVCVAGDVIARRVPPIPGRPGYTAMGRDVPAPQHQDSELVPGKNVRAEGDELIAEIDGAVVVGEAVSIRPLLVIEQDLSSPSDRIDFDGEVHLKGAARGGVVIRATGDIVASATVGEAELVSTSGSIYLKQGVSGGGRAMIRAATDIRARFAERATLFSNQDIFIEVGTINSRLIAYRNIEAATGRGRIVGGTLVAGELIRANQIGNETGNPVHMHCGLCTNQIEDMAKLEIRRHQLEDKIQTAQEAAEGIKRMVGDVATLDKDQKAIYARLLQVVMMARIQMRELEAGSEPNPETHERRPAGQVEVFRELHAGCSIEMFGEKIVIDDMRRACRIRVRNNEVEIGGL